MPTLPMSLLARILMRFGQLSMRAGGSGADGRSRSSSPHVTFLSDDWTAIGTKGTLGHVIEEITDIPAEALVHAETLDGFSVAQRLS